MSYQYSSHNDRSFPIFRPTHPYILQFVNKLVKYNCYKIIIINVCDYEFLIRINLLNRSQPIAPDPFIKGNAHWSGVHCLSYCSIQRGNDMNENSNERLTESNINTQEFLAKVEEAAREGAKQGSKGARGGIRPLETIKTIILIAMIVGIGWMVYRFNNFTGDLKDIVSRDIPVEEHDLTLENHGILGYTAADFQEAILGDSKQLKKLEVYTQDVSEAVQLTKTGLGRIKAFSKTQILTYKGTATYTVDLGKLKEEDITLDEEEMTVHLKIPRAELEPININENDLELGDVERGLLAIGKMSTTPEENKELVSEARSKMMDKLEEENVQEQADRFAKLSVWEIYQPIIDTVTKGYSLEVEIK